MAELVAHRRGGLRSLELDINLRRRGERATCWARLLEHTERVEYQNEGARGHKADGKRGHLPVRASPDGARRERREARTAKHQERHGKERR